MIKIRDHQGVTHFVAPRFIVHIKEAATSSQWHGIRSYVKLADGSTIDSSDTVETIRSAINDGEST